ncbi:STAS domain-containing protein [soil metagenome]
MDDDVSDAGDATHTAESPGIEVRSIDRTVVVSVQVDLDMLGAPHLAEAIRRVLSGAPSALIVDLTKVEFLASAGIAALVEAQELAGATTRFAVVAEGPATSRPLRLLGLGEILTLHSNLDDALRDMN